MNNRQRMYASNAKARAYILADLGGTHVYFKEHLKRKSKFHMSGDNFYNATDFFNLFDGLFIYQKRLVFFQVKTNAYANEGRIIDFLSIVAGFRVLVINVKTKPKHEIKVRWYGNND